MSLRIGLNVCFAKLYVDVCEYLMCLWSVFTKCVWTNPQWLSDTEHWCKQIHLNMIEWYGLSLGLAHIQSRIYMYIHVCYHFYTLYRIVLGKRPYSSSTKIWGWVVTQRRCLHVNGSTIPAQEPTLDVKLSARGYCVITSSLLCRGQPDSGESCIMLQSCIVLQSWPTHSLIAKFPQHSVVACSTQISYCRATSECVRTFDAWCCAAQSASEKLQLCELSGSTFGSLCKNLAWWAVTRRTSKNHKMGVGRVWALNMAYMY